MSSSATPSSRAVKASSSSNGASAADTLDLVATSPATRRAPLMLDELLSHTELACREVLLRQQRRERRNSRSGGDFARDTEKRGSEWGMGTDRIGEKRRDANVISNKRLFLKETLTVFIAHSEVLNHLLQEVI